MEAIVSEFSTDIFPTNDEVMLLCTPGQGAETCVWLMMGGDGWFCAFYNRPHALIERWKDGHTNAKRDGCDRVKKWNPIGSKPGRQAVP